MVERMVGAGDDVELMLLALDSQQTLSGETQHVFSLPEPVDYHAPITSGPIHPPVDSDEDQDDTADEVEQEGSGHDEAPQYDAHGNPLTTLPDWYHQPAEELTGQSNAQQPSVEAIPTGHQPDPEPDDTHPGTSTPTPPSWHEPENEAKSVTSLTAEQDAAPASPHSEAIPEKSRNAFFYDLSSVTKGSVHGSQFGSGGRPGLSEWAGLNWNVLASGAAAFFGHDSGSVGGDTVHQWYGTSAADAITISTGHSYIWGGGGADKMTGGAGVNQFGYTAKSDVVSGESVNGGAGDEDAIILLSGTDYDFSVATIAGVEILAFRGDGSAISASFKDNQLGTGAIVRINGAVDVANTLKVNGAAIDLSAVTFTNWTSGKAVIELHATGTVTKVKGSSLDDTIFLEGTITGAAVDGGGGTDTIKGGVDLTVLASLSGIERLLFDDGADTFTVTSAQIAAGINTIESTNAGTSSLIVKLGAAGETFSLAGVTFTGWQSGTDTITVEGGAGNDTVTGSANKDTLKGNGGDDTLNGGDGDDTLEGGDGIDTLDGGNGNDTLNGGLGADVLKGGDGNDTVAGGDGNDTLEGGIGDDAMDGGLGNDTLTGGTGKDTLKGDAGDDTLQGDDGDDSLDGGEGVDTLDGGNGNDTLNGGIGADVLKGGEGNDTVNGGDGFDTLEGGNGDDTMDGGLGNDTLAGGAGKDSLKGDIGDDTLKGEDGDDTLDGGSGDDNLDGGIGKDVLTGGIGADTLTGGDDDDTLSGGEGVDTLDGGNGNDSLDGGNGDDTLKGGAGNDTIAGGLNADTVQGEDGDDTLTGGEGNDVLDGGLGNDTLDGGADFDALTGGIGKDVLTGGGGNDRFIFTAVAESAVGADHDTITDFVIGEDRIDVSVIDANSTGGTADDAFTLLAGEGAAFTNTAGEIRFAFVSGNTLVQFDINGDGTADMEILLTGEKTLTAADFVL